jgi:hypothetical protein
LLKTHESVGANTVRKEQIEQNDVRLQVARDGDGLGKGICFTELEAAAALPQRDLDERYVARIVIHQEHPRLVSWHRNARPG